MSPRHLPFRLALLLALAVATPACGTAGGSGTGGTVSPPTVGGSLWYSRTDGAAVAISVATGQTVDTITSTFFRGANPGFGRGLAFDKARRRLWYAATDGIIYSLDVDTRTPGPSIRGVPGGVVGADRHLFVDYFRDELLVPLTNHTVQTYSLATQAMVRNIPAAAFPGAHVGHLRHFAADPRTGNVWYASTDGSFQELNPVSGTLTGRVVSFGQQVGANPGAYRHFVIDPVRNLLMYVVTDGSVASVELSTLTRSSFVVSGAAFMGADPGAARTITYDYPN